MTVVSMAGLSHGNVRQAKEAIPVFSSLTDSLTSTSTAVSDGPSHAFAKFETGSEYLHLLNSATELIIHKHSLKLMLKCLIIFQVFGKGQQRP